MKYQTFKMISGCLIPSALFAVVAGIVFWALFSSATGFGLLILGAPLGLGFCAALVAVFLSRPMHHWMLTREIKAEKSTTRIGGWTDPALDVEFYASNDGIWFNKQRYYWQGSLFLELTDLFLQSQNSRNFLIFKFRETLDRSSTYFDVQVPVPKGYEHQARKIRDSIIKENMLLDPEAVDESSPSD